MSNSQKKKHQVIHIHDTNKTYITDKFVITQNENLQYDICILAIGYQSNIKFMDLDKIPYMYKHIIHPDKLNCGFIGFTATFNWAQVSELQSKWFLNYINNTNNQTNKTKMMEDIKYEYIHQDNKSADYHDLAIDVYNYCDKLSNDIKLNNDMLAPNLPHDLRDNVLESSKLPHNE